MSSYSKLQQRDACSKDGTRSVLGFDIGILDGLVLPEVFTHEMSGSLIRTP